MTSPLAERATTNLSPFGPTPLTDLVVRRIHRNAAREHHHVDRDRCGPIPLLRSGSANSLLRDWDVGYPIDIRKPEVNDRLHRSLRSQRGGCRCDLFLHYEPSRCPRVVLVQFRRRLT
jgi:hypothetical protein